MYGVTLRCFISAIGSVDNITHFYNTNALKCNVLRLFAYSRFHVHKRTLAYKIMQKTKGPWVIYPTSPIKLVSFSKVLEFNDNVWSVTENYKAANDEEISLKKGQLVEVLVKPHGSSRWRVRLLLNEGINPSEGWAPHNALKRSDERDPKKKRHSDVSHSSSEGKLKEYEVIFVSVASCDFAIVVCISH